MKEKVIATENIKLSLNSPKEYMFELNRPPKRMLRENAKSPQNNGDFTTGIRLMLFLNIMKRAISAIATSIAIIVMPV